MNAAINTTIPPGYRSDAKGHLWTDSQIKAIDKTRDELVRELWKKAEVVNKVLADFKRDAFADIAAFVSLSA
ncbi:MAG: DUF3164 family protein, partial [Rhodanobacter sp.]